MSKIPNFEKFDVNEAIVAAGFGMNNMQNFGLGGGTPQTGYSMSAIAGTVGTSATAIGNQANEYEMNENDNHTAQGYLEEAKNHINESIDKAYENCKSIDEGYNKKSAIKAMGKSDDAILTTKDGDEFIIYSPSSGNDDNAATWKADGVMGTIEDDGESAFIKYTDIKSIKESINEASVQIAGDKKPSGAKILAMVIVDHLIDKKIVTMAYKKKLNAEIQDIIIKSTF
jgi:hypothetical protein